MRPRLACFCLIAIAALLLLSACGTGYIHEGPPPCTNMPGDCLAPQFVFATTGVGQILIFPVGQGGALGAPTSIAGPAVVGGNIAVSASQELFVADHVLGTLAAWAPGTGNSYSQVSGSPYSLAGGAGSTEGVAVTPDGRFVYVVGFGGGISGFAVSSTSSLAAIPGSPFPVAAGSVDAVTDASGKFLFVVSPSGVSGFSIDSVSGALTATGPPAALPGFSLPTPGMAATTPAPGNFLYVAVSGTNSVAAFSFDATTGVLTPVSGSPFPVGALPLTLTATLHAVYVMNSLDGTISALSWDANTGALSPISGSPYSAPWGGGDLAVLRNQYLYVPSINNVFPPNVHAILGYGIGPSGALTPLIGSPYQAGTQLWGGLAAP